MKRANYINAAVFLIVGAISFLLFTERDTKTFTMQDFLQWKIEQKKNKKPNPGFPDKAMQQYYNQRVYPLGFELDTAWTRKCSR